MEESGKEFSLRVDYDSNDDTLSFHFSPVPVPAVAGEATDEIWVRFEPETHRVVSIDVLNFSKRVHEVFGPSLTYTERTDPERLESLVGLVQQHDEIARSGDSVRVIKLNTPLRNLMLLHY